MVFHLRYFRNNPNRYLGINKAALPGIKPMSDPTERNGYDRHSQI